MAMWPQKAQFAIFPWGFRNKPAFFLKALLRMFR